FQTISRFGVSSRGIHPLDHRRSDSALRLGKTSSLIGCSSASAKLKTKNFTSDAEVTALVEAFESATIPAFEFTHVAHIAVAVSYLAELSPVHALERMRSNI